MNVCETARSILKYCAFYVLIFWTHGFGDRRVVVKLRSVLVCLVIVCLTAASLVGCGTGQQSSSEPIREVAFDLDDTLVFSTPAFDRAFNRAVEPFSDQFWAVVNSLDSRYSCIKPETVDLVEKHRRKNRELYVITAREPHNADEVREFIQSTFNIPKDHVYFEPDGKTQRLKALKIDLYYGDSDSDIEDARNAGVRGVRIQRSPKSSYDDSYSPGRYGETVLNNTAGHRCS